MRMDAHLLVMISIMPASNRWKAQNSCRSWVDIIAIFGDACAMRYDGGKGVAYPHIINLMPPHARYIETHLGGGAVMRHKKPATTQIGLEIDGEVIDSYGSAFHSLCEVIEVDAVEWLGKVRLDHDTLVYVDPPYHPSTRRRSRVYRYDYTEQDHKNLLALLCTLPAKVMISGYDCALYQNMLRGWNHHRFMIQSHVGPRQESLWFNFPAPTQLHDDRYLGKNFREREVIKRRLHRLKERLLTLTASERASIHSWLGRQLEKEEAP